MPAPTPRRTTAALLALAVALGVLALAPATPAAAQGARPAAATGRLAGPSRIDTAVAISRAAFPDGAATAFLARADVAADALAAGSLLDGPILLVPACGAVPSAVADELARLDPERVVALGGAAAVCDDLLAEAAGARASARLAGPSRVDTAAAIAVQHPDPQVVYVADAADGPDAVAAGSLADGPVLLVPRTGPIPTSVSAAVDALDPSTVIALGGTAVVPDDVLAGVAAGRPTDRLAGPGRVETAAAIAARSFPGTAPTAYLARGDVYADAIAAGTLADGPVLLVPSCGALPAVVADALDRLRPARVVALGGTAAVCDPLLQAAAGGAPGPGPTGDPIADALAAGRITLEESVRLRVLRLAGDPRLPADYAVAEVADEGFLTTTLAAAHWSSLSEATRRDIAPYLAPPAYVPDDPAFAQLNPAFDCFADDDDRRPTTTDGWVGIETTHAVVWYELDGDTFDGHLVATPEESRQTAEWAAEVIDHIYEVETATFGVTPPSDAGLPCDGGDGRLDVYIGRAVKWTGALTAAYAPGCELRPSFISLAPDFARTPELVRDALAHEFSHTLQLGAYDLHEECWTYNWLAEATGNWAVDLVYPEDQFEHPEAETFFRGNHQRPLWFSTTYGDRNGYEDWPFLQSIARTVGPAGIASVWDATTGTDSVDAFEQGLPGGADDHWHDFALRALNRPGADDLTRWDQVPWQVDPGEPLVYDEVDAVHDLRADLQGIVQPLTFTATAFEFGEDVRHIEFRGAGFGQGEVEHGKIQAWIRLADGRTRTQDVTGGDFSFCRDLPDEDVAELVLVHSNGYAIHDSGGSLINYPAEGAELETGDTCPSGWTGTITVTERVVTDRVSGVDSWTGEQEVTSTFALRLVPDPGGGDAYVATTGSTWTTTSSGQVTYTREGSCSSEQVWEGAGGGALEPDAGSLVLGLGAGDAALLLVRAQYDQHSEVTGDEACGGGQSFEQPDLFHLPGCPIGNGIGLDGRTTGEPGARTVDLACTDSWQGPREGDTTHITVTGRLAESG